MPDFFEVLKTRRTVRSYTPQPVSEEELQELIDLAVLAPTGMNAQPWSFTVVTNPETLRKLDAIIVDLLRSPRIQAFLPSERFKAAVFEPAYTNFYGAPALIVIAGNTSAPTANTDCQLAAENLFLAAHAKGLGTCYMGFLTMAKENPAVRDLLRIPEGYEMMAATLVGHPDQPTDEPAQRNPARVEWVR
jgi:nitroreductase